MEVTFRARYPDLETKQAFLSSSTAAKKGWKDVGDAAELKVRLTTEEFNQMLTRGRDGNITVNFNPKVPAPF